MARREPFLPTRDDGIDVQDYVAVIRRQMVTIVVAAVVGLVLALAYSYLRFSSPQQAAVYCDSSPNQQPKLYGIAGYTPITIKVPKGPVKIVLELSGFKPVEQVIDVRKSTSIQPTLERAPRMARLNLQASADGAGGDVLIDGVPRGTIQNTFELTAGRHQIEVRKAGKKGFSDWVDLQEGVTRGGFQEDELL